MTLLSTNAFASKAQSMDVVVLTAAIFALGVAISAAMLSDQDGIDLQSSSSSASSSLSSSSK